MMQMILSDKHATRVKPGRHLPDIRSRIEDRLLGGAHFVRQIPMVALQIKPLVTLQSGHESGFRKERDAFP